MRSLSYGEAIHEALEMAMERDPRVFVMGIGVDDHKAIWGTTKELVERFGRGRCFDTPISEAAMTGVAVGAALGGMRPVHVHIRADFLYLAMDQLFNIAAKWHYMFGGRMHVPLVIRAVIGRSWGQGAQHSQSPQSFFMHVPGIKVVMPTTPYDAKGLLLTALAEPNPVLFLEHRSLYSLRTEVPESYYEVPFGKAVLRREGSDLTIVANSYSVLECQRAAQILSAGGIEAEIVDPLSLVPLDEAAVLKSVRKTGRLLVVDTGWVTCGVGAEIAALVAEKAFGALKRPVRRLGNQHVPCPVSKTLESQFYPTAEKIAAAAAQLLDRPRALDEFPESPARAKGAFA